MTLDDQLRIARDELVRLMLEQKESFGFAESCTGGLLSALVAECPGVSKAFMGSVIAYSGEIKNSLLNVPVPLMQCMGQVSEPVARHMAKGAREALNCRWSLSVTGIAGPSGAEPNKPVGTVCFGIEGPGIQWQSSERFEGPDRVQIQKQAALFGFQKLKAFLP